MSSSALARRVKALALFALSLGVSGAQLASAQVWSPAAPYPVPISRYGFAQDGQDFYIISGFSGGGSINAVNRYNAVVNAWTPLANIPTKSQAPAAAYLSKKIYVADGDSGNGFQIYDIATNTWSAGPARPGVANSYGAAAGALNGKVYVVGGGTAGASTTVSVYDINTNTWGAGPAAPAAYLLGGYTQVGQYLYVIGSFTGNSAANSTVSMRLDMSTNTWSTGPTWTPARADFALAAAGSKLFAIGGDSNGGTSFNSSTQVDELDTSTWPAGAWSVSPDPLFSARQGNSAGFFSNGRSGGEIWSTGGFNPSTSEHLFRAVPCVISFDGAIGSPSATYPGTTGTQTNRVSRTVPVSKCGTSKAFPGASAGSFAFDQYSFTNSGPATCVTFTVKTSCLSSQQIFPVAYLGSFNPASISTNYLGDPAGSPLPSTSFSVNVPANSTVVLVLSHVSAAGACGSYSITVSGLSCPCFNGKALIAYADNSAPTQLETALQAEPGMVAVDFFDAKTGTPTVALLRQYDIVVPFSNSTFADATTLGNNLADYVDSGGVVVQLGFSFLGPNLGYGINGRWATGGYSPFTYNSTTIPSATVTLGTHDPGHPLMQGVSALQTNFRNRVTPAPGATQVAAWNTNDSLLALKPVGTRFTVGITGYLGTAANWSGGFAHIIANAGGLFGKCPVLKLISAVSRKTHNGLGPFDVNLPLEGAVPGLESRSGSAGHTLVFTFTSAVVSGSATVTAGTGSAGAPTFVGNTMTVPLSGVADMQKIAVTLSSVTNVVGQVLPNTTVSMNVLMGDSNGDKFVNSGDATQVRSRSGEMTGAANFRSDFNLDGTINSGDATVVRSRSGQFIP